MNQVPQKLWGAVKENKFYLKIVFFEDKSNNGSKVQNKE